MKMMVFASRTTKEVLRDPLNFGFGVGFPVVLILLLTAIQHNVPVAIFTLDTLVPGIAVFGMAFLSLFSAQLVSKDRCTSMAARLFTTPLTASDFILGYTLPLIPMAIVQAVLCYILALILGLAWTTNMLWAVLVILPTSVFFIALGLLCGSVMNDKQVGGFCGALLTNLTAWLSGTWFSLDLVGGWFKKIAYCLPFAHATDLGRAALAGDLAAALPHLWWVLGYALAATVAAILLFRRKMKME